jgi:hypothetical protein
MPRNFDAPRKEDNDLFPCADAKHFMEKIVSRYFHEEQVVRTLAKERSSLSIFWRHVMHIPLGKVSASFDSIALRKIFPCKQSSVATLSPFDAQHDEQCTRRR